MGFLWFKSDQERYEEEYYKKESGRLVPRDGPDCADRAAKLIYENGAGIVAHFYYPNQNYSHIVAYKSVKGGIVSSDGEFLTDAEYAEQVCNKAFLYYEQSAKGYTLEELTKKFRGG